MEQWIENKRTNSYELVDELGIMYQALSIATADMLFRLDFDRIPYDLVPLIAEKFEAVAIA